MLFVQLNNKLFASLNKFKLIKKLSLKFYKKYILSYMRGYNKAKKKYGIYYLDDLKIDLAKVRLKIDKDLKNIFPLDNFDINISFTQLVQIRTIDLDLFKTIYSSIQKGHSITYPLPKEYQNLLKKKGLKVNEFNCNISISLLSFAYLLKSLVTVYEYIFNSLFKKKFRSKEFNQKSAFFLEFPANAIPTDNSKILKYNIFTWFKDNIAERANISIFYHDNPISKEFKIKNIPILQKKYPIDLIYKKLKLFKLFLFFNKEFIKSFFLLLIGNWKNAFILEEIFFAYLCVIQRKEFLAKYYLFHNDWRYRPIWTYVAEDKGSKVLFHFYSTNNEGIKTKQGYRKIKWDFLNLSWSKYIVWDLYQKEQLESNLAHNPQFINSEFIIGGPLCIQPNKNYLKVTKKNSISVFDVIPVRTSFYRSLGLWHDYYVPTTSKLFFKDILDICMKLGVDVYVKQKRDFLNKGEHPIYRKILKEFKNQKNITLLNSEISAEEIISKTTLSISMPFTSTAILAKFLGKNCCYYDGTGQLFDKDSGAHGIDLILNKKELEIWITSNINKIP